MMHLHLHMRPNRSCPRLLKLLHIIAKEMPSCLYKPGSILSMAYQLVLREICQTHLDNEVKDAWIELEKRLQVATDTGGRWMFQGEGFLDFCFDFIFGLAGVRRQVSCVGMDPPHGYVGYCIEGAKNHGWDHCCQHLLLQCDAPFGFLGSSGVGSQ